VKTLTALLLLVVVATDAWALNAPTASVAVAGPGKVRLTYQHAVDVLEFNVIYNGVRHITLAVRGHSGSADFFGEPGVYCVIGIYRFGDQISASECTTPVDLDVPEPPQARFALSVPQTQFELQEGDVEGVDIPIDIVRSNGRPVPVELSLFADTPQGELNMVYEFADSIVAQDQSSTELNIQLTIDVAPLLEHKRSYVLVADDGLRQQEQELVFTVKPVEAPDVYLLIGQSNMVGSSELGAKDSAAGGLDELNERIRQLNVMPNNRLSVFKRDKDFTNEAKNVFEPRFVIAEDPLHEPRYPAQPGKGGTHIGLGLSFAKSALKRTTQSIYLVPAAWGASGFCANNMGKLGWNAAATNRPKLGGTLLADRALTRLNMTLRDTDGILRGILWHQGGADANTPECADTYAENLSKMVARFRDDALVDARGASARGSGANIPFMVGTQSKGRDERSDFSQFSRTKNQVDSVHRMVAELIPHADYVNHDDLIPPSYPCGMASCVHFGAAAYREMGARFDDALVRILGRRQ